MHLTLTKPRLQEVAVRNGCYGRKVFIMGLGFAGLLSFAPCIRGMFVQRPLYELLARSPKPTNDMQGKLADRALKVVHLRHTSILDNTVFGKAIAGATSRPAIAAQLKAAVLPSAGARGMHGVQAASAPTGAMAGLQAAAGGEGVVGLPQQTGMVRSGIRCAATDSKSAVPSSGQGRPRVTFILGGPGCGKGTQCERLAESFGLQHLSAGDLLRQERGRPNSPLGEEIDKTIKAGRVVPSAIIAKLLEQAMREAGWDEAKGFLVDGYPRSLEQLQGWESELSPLVDFQFVLYLEVGQEELRQRLLGRGLTSGRTDDNAATIEKRFETFKSETGPVVDHFDTQGLLRRVDGERGPDEVFAEVRQLFECVAQGS
eukprot:gnl/TRDRNA2_/TRDRNA2_29264_c0_seq1.p1 gnl/TRDRNA2_/TRDRNA2_29264_c0~~gnl/TRDRNA2_/TRDRNA2_29264_c0_seq1.p1  ORF type:complete len:372 (+),score=56.53 gnl/TRDRNA2_/TRDRNA2_29264_c0_seq1:63-1178(+)